MARKIVTIGSRGRIIIPKVMLNKLKLEIGSEILLTCESGNLIKIENLEHKKKTKKEKEKEVKEND